MTRTRRKYITTCEPHSGGKKGKHINGNRNARSTGVCHHCFPKFMTRWDNRVNIQREIGQGKYDPVSDSY